MIKLLSVLLLLYSPEYTRRINANAGIHPNRPTPRLVSWFPMMFPLRTPVRVQPPAAGAPANDQRSRISLAMWRVCSEQRVWYECIINMLRDDQNQNLKLHRMTCTWQVRVGAARAAADRNTQPGRPFVQHEQTRLIDF